MSETQVRYRWIYGELRSERRHAKQTENIAGESYRFRLFGHPNSSTVTRQGNTEKHAATLYADELMQRSNKLIRFDKFYVGGQA
jgi:hypothetical protein